MNGTYVLSNNENYDAFLKAIGIPDEKAALMLAAVPTVEIEGTGNGAKMTVKAGDKVFNNTVTWGQDSPQQLAGINFVVNASKTADGYGGSLTSPGGKKGTIEVKKTADGLCQIVTFNGVTAKRCYKKQ